jgi:ubiquinone/menaquinone biosynthesis C-methylase UbiE
MPHVAVRLPVTLCLCVLLLAPLWGRQASRTHPLSGRTYAGTMDVAGAAWLDRREREAEESPTRALEIIGVPTGATVADIGAGSGYYTMRMAKLVGPSGRVYANDIQQGMLDIIGRKVAQAGLMNVTLVLGVGDDPRLPPASLDLALLVDVYHEFHAPQAMLRGLYSALKPGGRLVLLEYREEDPEVPILRLHKMSLPVAKLEVESEGFTLATVNEDLPWQHVLIFTRP